MEVEQFICNYCISNKTLVFTPNTNFKDFDELVGTISMYSAGGHTLLLNPYKLTRSNFNMLLILIQESLLLRHSVRMLMINFNAIHNYYKTILKYDIIIEFSITGVINLKITSSVKLTILIIGC